ncbi:MAG: hypothetical protein RH942_10650 [Kiloniellaceae bacterium]
MSIPIASAIISFAPSRHGNELKNSILVVMLTLAVAACSSSGPSYKAARGYQPCYPQDALDTQTQRCETGRNVLVAMAAGQEIPQHELVASEVLEEQRGGYIAVGGLRLDFGFEFSTIVNGTPQLTSALTLGDFISGNGPTPALNTVSVSGGSGVTDIIHAVGPNGIGATIINSQDGVQIENISTLSIDIIGLGRVHQGGRALGNGRRMPLEVQQSIIRALK